MKKMLKSQEGSALVLTIIVLVNALLIVTTITAISVIEQKVSSKTKNSTPAYQAADSAMEWALKRLQDTTIAQLDELCPGAGGFNTTTNPGRCDPGLAFPDPNTITEIYFVNNDGVVITNPTESPSAAVSMRTVGRFGDGDDRVSRALEVHLGQSGPIAWWPFMEADMTLGGGTDSAQGDEVDDITTNDNNATAFDGQWVGFGTGTEGLVPCFAPEDTCMEFDGEPEDGIFGGANDDYVQVDDSVPLYQLENGTVSMWFRASDLNHSYQGLWSKETADEHGSDLSFYVLDDNSFFGTIYGLSTPSGNDHLLVRHQKNTNNPGPNQGDSYMILSDDEIDEDDWYFMAYTFGAAGSNLYLANATDLDLAPVIQSIFEFKGTGVPGPNPVDNGLQDNFNNIQFGASATNRVFGTESPKSSPLDGYVDDIRIYNYQLNLTQIDSIYDAGPS
ncbi:MAG: hypothetical protein U9O20_03170 [Patescibacteria group bacterium]|nr:hypothetical protein [Patescibacteria group bacterium]